MNASPAIVSARTDFMADPLRLAGAILVGALAVATACATPGSSSGTGTYPRDSGPRADGARTCFPVERLDSADRALADTLLARGLDNEALYTLAARLKPMSSLYTLSLAVARPDSVPVGKRDVVKAEHLDLARMTRYQRVANALSCGPLHTIILPYRMPQDSVRVLQLSVVHAELIDSVLIRDAPFWGQWGLVPGADPAVIVTLIEFSENYDRFRGYGYLFGYPEHAVDFFVEAARTGDAEDRLVPRDFFHIPVHSRETGRFVYAVPKDHEPLDVDLALQARAADILTEYRARRLRHTNVDGTLRAAELLRAWWSDAAMAETTGQGLAHFHSSFWRGASASGDQSEIPP